MATRKFKITYVAWLCGSQFTFLYSTDVDLCPYLAYLPELLY